MSYILVSDKAKEDLQEIWGYIAGARSVKLADEYLDNIEEILELCARNPLLGRARPLS